MQVQNVDYLFSVVLQHTLAVRIPCHTNVRHYHNNLQFHALRGSHLLYHQSIFYPDSMHLFGGKNGNFFLGSPLASQDRGKALGGIVGTPP